jgi:phospholipase/carboxylesterase
MLSFRIADLGGLSCVVAEGAHPDRQTHAAVIMHGFGATGHDLVPLAEEFCDQDPLLAERVRFIFPAAPIEPVEMADYGGRAWWPIDMLRLQRAAMLNEWRELRTEEPPLLPAARDLVLKLIRELQSETGWGMERIVLGGFSQGSMLATDVALRLDEAPAGLIVFSGTLLSESQWRSLAPGRAGLPVVQSHGRQDPVLPYSGAEALRDMLTESGLPVEFLPFNGPHTISQEAIASAAGLLSRLTAAV